jgi:serine/threonine-protein kinase TTK/MPS1
VRVNKKPYIKMACIGRGGSSKVYRVISPEYKLFALKRVKIGSDDPGAFANYANEINLLQRYEISVHLYRLHALD